MIELQDVSYAYGGEAVLRGMDLTLAPGSFHFLTGPSGSGKTTFLRLLARQLVPTGGTLRIFGDDAAAMDRDAVAGVRRRIGVVHQDLAFLDHLSVAENVALPLTVAGRSDPEAVRELLAWTGLGSRARALPPQLSGGERQRMALARAVVMSPDVVLADEPTGNVDWEMSMRLMTLLVELNRMGKTVLIATHDLGLIRAMKGRASARTLRIRDGAPELAGAGL
ncbi:cell division transport system ATP-binding protein [Hasllibacter halocynthiae]|uniref:Cell division transport system ATP-binding protein n=1 Tax=Hasllibacter halocynthiae TaxID=595589 RepID=A0A2T0X3X2_9RHOB|nr:ATP-binding cassette domain-containing protein [Hasllibacter halocynthiae]PRY93642.1 cell division transport system ATP-binding protein [Hasllibacter halocynthiae]